ncbi:MAG: hypothetical protein KC492_29975, partial [Myxococcales bacterium]|nr:hypothetical protein [Myxococcales bacterium]
MATELGDSPLAACRDLATLLVDRAVVAAIARGWLDLDETLRRITLGAVARLDPLGETHDVVAAHLSRSTRWLHRHLHDVRTLSGRRRRADVALRLPPELGASPGYTAMLKATSRLERSEERPSRSSKGSPLQAVRAERLHDNGAVTAASLRLYAAMG